MNQKTITIVLAGITAVLFSFCVFLLATDDRRPPVIKIGGGAVSDYREGEGTDKLLADVSAFDDEDGDVTDTLAVEAVIPLADGASAKIYFVAMDKSGNIGKESMIVSYTPSDEHRVSAEGQNTGEPGADSSESAEEVPASETKTEETKGDPSGETLPESESEAESGSETVQSTEKPTTPDAEIPKLTLKTHEITLTKGSRLIVQNQIEDITDDTDTREELFRRIGTRNDPDLNTPGTYEMEIYVTDSDGNISNREKLKVIVTDN